MSTSSKKNLEPTCSRVSSYKLAQPNSAILCLFEVVMPIKENELSLQQYLLVTVQSYIEVNWTERRVQRLVQRLQRDSQLESADLKQPDPLLSGNQESVITFLKQRLHARVAINSPLRLLQRWIIQQALTTGQWKSVLHPSVGSLLHHWRMRQFIKLFSLADLDAKMQKLLLQHSDQEDTLSIFNNCIECSDTNRRDVGFYRNVASLLRDAPANLLFITDKLEESMAAEEAGFRSVVVGEIGGAVNCLHELRFLPVQGHMSCC